MNYLLVLQWPSDGGTDDYDALVAMEDALLEGLPDDADVDGHDMGSGEMNIFVETQDPSGTFAEVSRLLSDSPRWGDVKAAYRPTDGDEFTTLWPAALETFTVG